MIADPSGCIAAVGVSVGRGTARPTAPHPTADLAPIIPHSHSTTSMGGRLVIHLDVDNDRDEHADSAAARSARAAGAARTSAAVAARIGRWAALLTRHSETSDLSLLNADPRDEVPVRPTLAAILRTGQLATERTEGLVDITLLRARLAAEGLVDASDGLPSQAPDWSLVPGRRGSAIVRRPPQMRFDLDGVGKGWIADRALGLLAEWPGAVIDADGDLAIRVPPGKVWEVAVDDPRTPDTHLAVLRLAASTNVPGRWGVATSGISIHRWTIGGQARHHLIDPRTGMPAATDVVQATVIAGSALRAETLAKAAVIAGRYEGLALLERAHVAGAILLTSDGDVIAPLQTLDLLGR